MDHGQATGCHPDRRCHPRRSGGVNRSGRHDVTDATPLGRSYKPRPLVIVSGVAVLVGVALLVGVAVLVTGGSGPDTLIDAYTMAAITPDGDDVYLVDQTPDGAAELSVVAPGSNRSGNLRVVAVGDDVEASVDQESCITWLGPRHDRAQPGLALRVTSSAGRTRAITVSNNIWLQDRSSFNVHLADTATDDALVERMVAIGKIEVPTGLGDDLFTVKLLPWRMCARAKGTTIEVKAWSTDEQAVEPAWGDLGFAGSVEVPSDWVHAGRPGFYMAHLAPGERAELVDAVTRPLPPGPGDR